MPGATDQILDLLATSSSRWRTLRATGREWRDHLVLAEAWQAAPERISATPLTRIDGPSGVPVADTEPVESEERWSLWLAPPWKRAQFPVGGGMVDVVFRGSEWWSNTHGRSLTNVGNEHVEHGLGWGDDLVRTSEYIDLLEIGEVIEGSAIGRRVLEAWVTPRHDNEHRYDGKGLHGLIIGDTDRVRLAVDVERGVILRTEAWFRGSLYRTLEILDVGFDDNIDQDVFNIAPIPGQDWATPHVPTF